MENIENIYSLSPLQQGLLFHSVYEPTSRVYQQQLSLCIAGKLDLAAFKNAWQQIMDRHSVLRTAILWEDLDDAYQVVLADLPLPLTELDWRDHSDQATALRELEFAQREEPLDLASPPLMRICLVRLDENRWQFIWTHHHIVLDGWSEGIVLRDWLSSYRALSQHKTPSLLPTRPFQDYIAWLAEQDAAAAERYWRDRLGAIVEPTPLPQFSAHAPIKNDLLHPELPFAEQSLKLSSEESRRLLDFAKAERLTLNTLIQAAWGWLLGHYAGRQQALYGVTVGGRSDTLAHAEEMVGLFINTLPLSVEWEKDLAIGDWLRQLQAQAAELRQYEYSALYRLKAFSGLPADQKLFEAILVFENFPLDESLSEAALGDETAELRFSASDTATRVREILLTQGRNNFPLSLIAIPEGEAFEFAISYLRHRFTDDQIGYMLRHFHAVLNALTQNAEAAVSTLQCLSEIEQQQLINWGTGAHVTLPEKCLHQLFEQHADGHPQQEALSTGKVQWSYADLDARANQVARLLLDHGVKPGQFVAIALERNANFIMAMLGVLKAGAAYLPLDLKQPAARLAELLADSRAPVVLTHSNWRRQFATCITPRLELDQLQEQLSATSSARLIIAVTPDAPAYLIYTSGSTGTPKGVVVEHRALVNYLHSVHRVLSPAEGSRYGMLSTIAADLGHTQLFGALCLGGTLVLADEDTSFNPLALADFLSAQRVDTLKITPSHLRGLLHAHPTAALLPREILVFGGDALDNTLLEQVRALAPTLKIFNHYGPTEATVGAIAGEVFTHKSLDSNGTAIGIPLGKPLPNRRLYVLDAQGRPSPVGVPGELFIGGALAQAYLNRPQLTEECFVPDAIAADGKRLYRTGDRVRWLTNGELAFLGRIDNQIKLRGNRIELGEVEAHVKRLSSYIRQVVVRLLQQDGQPARLVAYIVAAESLSVTKLRDDLSIRVPDYMMPSHFITLDAIPLTANGKPDYRQLPLPQDLASTGTSYVAPRNEIEQLLANIWQDVLKVERVGIHDNFFTLGGDSIFNLQIIARANQQGLRLTPKQLFDNRTVSDIAAVLMGSTTSVETHLRTKSQLLPLSAGQKAVLETGALQATWRCLAIDKTINRTELVQALAALQQHHQSLRLALEKTPQGAWQQCLSAQPKPLSVREHTFTVSSRGLAWINNDTLAELADSCLQQLDLAAGETLHACLLQDTACADQQALLLVAHPLSLDEASWPIILSDLGLALAQIKFQRPVRLMQTGGDFILWNRHQQEYANSEPLEIAWEHWLQYAGLELPTLEYPPATTKSVSMCLDSTITTRLRHLCETTHLSWSTLLATLLGEQIAAQRSQNDDMPILLDIDCGRPDLIRLPVDAPIATANVDPSHIAGPLSLAVPVFLQWPALADPLQRLHLVDAQLFAQPQRGADYGVLRYLVNNPYMQESLLTLPRAQCALRWLGDWDAHQETNGLLHAVTAASQSNAADYAFSLDACLQESQLLLRCRGSLANSWASALVQRLTSLAEWAETQRLYPADHAFPLCRSQTSSLSAHALDWGNIEDIYPLTPMQQGMLLHTLLQPHSGVYLMQQQYQWDGVLEQSALAAAWAQLLQRHPQLRTALWWQEDNAPLQCVYRSINNAFAWYDLCHLDEAAQRHEIQQILAQERRQGFDMQRGPLTYLRVFHLKDSQYLMVRSFHHILTDAWCFGLLMEDLLALYQAQRQHEPAARPLLQPFRYYISWLARQDLRSAETFWRTELAGFSAPTPLVVDTPTITPEQAPEEINNVDITLSVVLTQRLQQLCQQHQLTANTWLQGAWALLLSRYCGQDDVLFGITVAGRPTELPGVEDMVGLFINSLPLRVKIRAEQDVISWLQGLLARNVDLRDYEHSPLVEIQRWSEIPRGQPLFDSLVVFENAIIDVDVGSLSQRDFNFDMLEDRVHTNFPITVMLYPGDRLGIRLSYDAHRFTQASIERMLGHLVQLLSAMLAQPSAPLSQLDMLQTAERQQLLVDWNNTAVDFPLRQTYAELFSAQAAKMPHRVAAVCQGETLTYAELNARANRIAHVLIAQNIGPDKIVALMAERGLPLLTMMIAVFKAGAAYMPLDINHPPDRLRELLELSGASVLLTSEASTELLDRVLAGATVRPHCLVTESIWLQGDAIEPPFRGGPDNLAYVIFTSGSTGTPKGAMVEQRGMLNNIFGKLPTLNLCESDRLAQTAPIAFDISVWQFLAAPLLGATVHILPDAITQDPQRMLEAIDSEGITLMELVPSVMRVMLEMCPPSITLVSLRWLMSIGEALPPVLCRRWFERFPGVPLMNLYGPAECADNIGFYPITHSPADDCLQLPIGRPTANNQLFVLNSDMQPVPVGVPGEICTAGVGVGRGYLNDPERTLQAFVPHPFNPGARFYRTGDIGRYRAEGVIEYLGRRDHQIKVRGQRIELGEIESRLTQHSSIQAAAVVAVADPLGGAQLVAYYVAKDGTECDNEFSVRLCDHLRRQLPAYMLPAHWVALDKLPVNANGKTDRRALSLRGLPASANQAGVLLAPRTITEQRLADIWKEILHLTDIGIHDNFFALGGHSLLATQMTSRIRKALDITLPLKSLFEHASIAELALYIDAIRNEQPQQTLQLQQALELQLPPITPQARGMRLPLSFAQQRLWFMYQLQPGQQVFTLPSLLTLTGELNVAALQKSFSCLLERHEILRTAIISEQGEPWQQIKPPHAFDLPLEQLPTSVIGSQESIQAYVQHFLQHAFDLSRPPLLRAKLYQLQPHEHLLTIAVHHIVVDDWSLGILVQDLLTAYNAFQDGKTPNLPQPRLQYADFSVWQRQLPDVFWQQQLRYWRQQLAGSVPILHLPERRDEAHTHATALGRYQQQLPYALTTALHSCAEDQGCTPFMVLYAAFNILLSQQTGRNDLLIGTDVANRHHIETEEMMGFFVNQLVLRCRVEPHSSFDQLLMQCRNTLLEAYQHQDLPFDNLVANLLPQRDNRYTPFFQIKMIYQNAPQRDLTFNGLDITEWELPPRQAEFDLLVNCIPTPEGLHIRYDYNARHYSSTTIEKLAALFTNLLDILTTHTDTRLADITVAQLSNMLNQQQQSLDQSLQVRNSEHRPPQRASLSSARRKAVASVDPSDNSIMV